MTVRGRPRRRRPGTRAADPEGLGAMVSSWVSDLTVMRYADRECSWAEGLVLGAAISVSADLRRRVNVWRRFSAALQSARPWMGTRR